MSNTAKGIVSQVMGPVVDVAFEEGFLPSIYNAQLFLHVFYCKKKNEMILFLCMICFRRFSI